MRLWKQLREREKKYCPKWYRLFVSLHIHPLEAKAPNEEFYRHGLGLGEAGSVKAEPSGMGFMWS